MINKKILLGSLSVIVCEVLFGFSYLFTKMITDSIPPLTLISWRFIFAFLFMNICIIMGIIKVDFRNKSISSLFFMAMFQPFLYFIGETIGINLTSASESGVILASIPIVTLSFSALILKKIPTRIQITGVIITAIGIIVITLAKGLEATFNPIGYIMLFLAVISYSLYAIFSEKAVEFTSTEKTYAMITFGAVLFTFIALIENLDAGTLEDFFVLPFTNLNFLIAVLYLSISCSVVAFLLYNLAISYIGTNKSASFVGVSTIVTVMASIVILKEQVTFIQILGATLVITGVYLANVVCESSKSEGEQHIKEIVSGDTYQS